MTKNLAWTHSLSKKVSYFQQQHGNMGSNDVCAFKCRTTP